MSRRIFLLLAMAIAIAPSSAGAGICRKTTTLLDLTLTRGGVETVLGPTTLDFRNINRLRYEITIGSNVQFTDGPNLSLAGFIPRLPTAPQAPAAAAAEPAPPPPPPPPAGRPSAAERQREELEEEFERLHEKLARSGEKIKELLDKAEASREAITRQQQIISGLVQNSDQRLASPNGAHRLAEEIRTTILPALDTALTDKENDWPSDAEIKEAKLDLEQVSKEIQKYALRPGFQEWVSLAANSKRYEEMVGSAQGMAKAIGALERGSEERTAFEKMKLALIGWRSVLAGLRGEEDFQTSISVECGHPFFRNKTVAFEMTKRDRTIEDPTKATVKQQLIVVECPSVATLTAGVGVSGLKRKRHRPRHFSQGGPGRSRNARCRRKWNRNRQQVRDSE